MCIIYKEILNFSENTGVLHKSQKYKIGLRNSKAVALYFATASTSSVYLINTFVFHVIYNNILLRIDLYHVRSKNSISSFVTVSFGFAIVYIPIRVLTLTSPKLNSALFISL